MTKESVVCKLKKRSISDQHYPQPTTWIDVALQIIAEPGNSRVFSLIGGGGKTSLMYHWAACLEANGYSVVTTTTTKLADQPRKDVSILAAGNLPEAIHLLKQIDLSRSIFTLVSDQKPAPGKLAGIPAEWFDQLSLQFPATFFLVEADGSAGRSLKGHLAHEPVIPACTSLVIPVIGLDAVGKPIDEDNVHRPGQFSLIAGSAPEGIITEAMVAKVLLSSSGYLHNTPDSATIIPYVNKIETLAQFRSAKKLTKLILTSVPPQLTEVLAGSLFKNYLVRLR